MKRLLLILFCLSGVISYSFIPVQYHIQTDKGPDRYFRYQTYNGQFRKEKRFDDGSVVGSYGWVDATGLLRLYDYFADDEGYRIVRTRFIKVDKPTSYPSAGPKTPVRRPVPVHRPAFGQKTPTSSDVAVSQGHKPHSSTNLRPSQAYQPHSPSISKPRPSQAYQPHSPSISKPRPSQGYKPPSRSPNLRPIYVKKKVQKEVTPTYNNQVASFGSKISSSSPTQKAHDEGPPAGYRLDGPGGRLTINYDIGNQYRKEKLFPDGSVVGEHGYVDPLGILRRTYYRSGSHGLQEVKRSYWVGTRTPGS